MTRFLSLIAIAAAMVASSQPLEAMPQCANGNCFGWPGANQAQPQNFYSTHSYYQSIPVQSQPSMSYSVPGYAVQGYSYSSQGVPVQSNGTWTSSYPGSNSITYPGVSSVPGQIVSPPIYSGTVIQPGTIVEYGQALPTVQPGTIIDYGSVVPATVVPNNSDPGGITHIDSTPIAPAESAKSEDEPQEESNTESTDEIILFDGTSLDQWRGYKEEKVGAGWKIDDGVLKFDGSGGGDIVTREKFENFEFTFEWAVTESANSGVMYRVRMGDSAPYLSGPEYQILDDAKHNDGKSPLTSAAALYGLYSRGDAETKPVGEWNTGKIVIQNGKVQHWLNGTLAVESEIGSNEWKAKVKNSKFRDWENFGVIEEGHLCLQDHGDEVWFRNMKVKRLPKE